MVGRVMLNTGIHVLLQGCSSSRENICHSRLPVTVCTNGRRLPVAIPVWPLAREFQKHHSFGAAAAPGDGSLNWARGGGRSAQESDDITGQPLKDELFPRATPASSQKTG